MGKAAKNRNIKAICYAIAAAGFYALNAPCSKLLLKYVAPAFMAAFLYLGAGLGVGGVSVPLQKEAPTERLAKADVPHTVGMVLLDILAPILLMIGLRLGTSASAVRERIKSRRECFAHACFHVFGGPFLSVLICSGLCRAGAQRGCGSHSCSISARVVSGKTSNRLCLFTRSAKV